MRRHALQSVHGLLDVARDDSHMLETHVRSREARLNVLASRHHAQRNVLGPQGLDRVI